jgi:ABC-2 type transport system ATP-binding protein
MDHGQVVAEGTPDEPARDFRRCGAGWARQPADAGKLLEAESFVRRLEVADEHTLRLYVEDGATAIPLILRSLDAAGMPLHSIELHRPSLDDVFLTKTGRSLRES